MIDKGSFLRLVQGERKPQLPDDNRKPSSKSKQVVVLIWLLIILLIICYFSAITTFPILRCRRNYYGRHDVCGDLHSFFWIIIAVLFSMTKPFPKKTRKSSVNLNVDAFGLLGIKCCSDMPEPRADILRDAGFLPQYDTFWKDDILYLPNEKVPFYISEIMLKSKGIALFHGVVVSYQMKKDFKRPLLLLSRKDFSSALNVDFSYSSLVRWKKASSENIYADGMFDIFEGEMVNQGITAKVAGENEDTFDVDTFLTTPFLEELKRLEDAFKVGCNVLFYKDMIILSLNVRRNLFEISSADSKLDQLRTGKRESMNDRELAEYYSRAGLKSSELDKLDESDLSRLYDEVNSLVRVSDALALENSEQ